MTGGTPTARRGPGSVVVTGAGAASAYGRGAEALLSGVLSGEPAFAPVERFGTANRRVHVAAAMPGSPDLLTEIAQAVSEACDDAALPAAVRARVSIEAGIALGWREYVGDAGASVSLEHFGASADYKKLYEEFGITAEHAAAAARDSLARVRAAS